MVSRRSLTKALAGLPFLGPIIKTTTTTPSYLTHGIAAQAQSIHPPGFPSGLQQSQGFHNKIAEPIMSRAAATRLLFKNKKLKDEFVSAAYEINHKVDYIDPDLQVLKSFSPMAKITFQRQRNVEKYVQQHLVDEDKNAWHIVENIINSLVRKIMYGEK